MKFLTLAFLLIINQTSFSQIIATTEDGRKIILESNKTWKYLDSNKSDIVCNLPADFIEPKSDKAMYMTLKTIGATIDDMKSYVAADNDCKLSDVKILSFSEQLGSGVYNVCVKGIKMKYRKTGSVFSKYNENLL